MQTPNMLLTVQLPIATWASSKHDLVFPVGILLSVDLHVANWVFNGF